MIDNEENKAAQEAAWEKAWGDKHPEDLIGKVPTPDLSKAVYTNSYEGVYVEYPKKWDDRDWTVSRATQGVENPGRFEVKVDRKLHIEEKNYLSEDGTWTDYQVATAITLTVTLWNTITPKSTKIITIKA
jgi:hypothetical protein